MPNLDAVKVHHLGGLHEEILAAFPALAATLHVEDASGPRQVPDPANPGRYVTLPAEPPDALHLRWPDASGVTLAQVQAIVDAHTAIAPVRPDPLEGVNVSAVDALVAQAVAASQAAAAATNLAEAKAALVDLGDCVADQAQAIRKIVRYLRRRAAVAE